MWMGIALWLLALCIIIFVGVLIFEGDFTVAVLSTLLAAVILFLLEAALFLAWHGYYMIKGG